MILAIDNGVNCETAGKDYFLQGGTEFFNATHITRAAYCVMKKGNTCLWLIKRHYCNIDWWIFHTRLHFETAITEIIDGFIIRELNKFRTFRIQAGELLNARNEILLHERLRHHVLLAGLKENRQVFVLWCILCFLKFIISSIPKKNTFWFGECFISFNMHCHRLWLCTLILNQNMIYVSYSYEEINM